MVEADGGEERVRVVVAAANLHEKKDEVWLADLTGSMMREGTASLTADDFPHIAIQSRFSGRRSDVSPDIGKLSTDAAMAGAPGVTRAVFSFA